METTWTTKEVDELFHLIDRYEKLFEKFELRAVLFGEHGNLDQRTAQRVALIEMPVPIWKVVRSIKEGRVLFFNVIKKRGVLSCLEKKRHSELKRKRRKGLVK